MMARPALSLNTASLTGSYLNGFSVAKSTQVGCLNDAKPTSTLPSLIGRKLVLWLFVSPNSSQIAPVDVLHRALLNMLCPSAVESPELSKNLRQIGPFKMLLFSIYLNNLAHSNVKLLVTWT